MIIKNVDESGNKIKEVDFNVWNRERVEEVLDDSGKLVGLISHCRRFTETEINRRDLIESQSSLNATDYISAKFFDEIIDCSNAIEFFKVLAEYNLKYREVIEQRKNWRAKIKEIETINGKGAGE